MVWGRQLRTQNWSEGRFFFWTQEATSPSFWIVSCESSYLRLETSEMNYSHAEWIHMLNKSLICCEWQNLSWLTLGTYSPKQCNFPLQFIVQKATWESGLKCVLDLDIHLPKPVEWLSTHGINTLIRYWSLPGFALTWPLQCHLCSQLLHSTVVILDYCESLQLTVCLCDL